MNTVLIADDNPKVIKLLRRMLQNERYEVIEAADGNECVELFQQYSPAVVLIDIIMPGKDGLTTIQEI
jgi:CheY-like chemotaxis protein